MLLGDTLQEANAMIASKS